MRDEVLVRLRELQRRAGLSGLPPAVLGVGIGVLALAVCFGLWRWWPHSVSGAGVSGDAVLTESPTVAATTTAPAVAGGAEAPAQDASSDATGGVWVDVVGAVRHPGLYRVAAGARVNDAIDAAGGLLGDAAEEGVNLARQLTDGEQLVVPTADEFAKSGGAAGSAGVAPAGGASGATPAARVNINTATAEQLDVLPGVGPATATKIVADREANGPFASADDLGRVAGIGPKKLDDLRDLIVVH